mgnify:CR=1 FL=1
MDIDRYPVGLFVPKPNFDEKDNEIYMETIKLFPDKLEELVDELPFQHLHKKYRSGGWKVYQIVNHCADSHANALIRFKLALTEDNPVIKPYLESKWADLPDSNEEIEDSLSILKGLHSKWHKVLKNMTRSDYCRTYFHPETQSKVYLYNALGMYDWHCRHHFKHIENALSNG